MVYSEFVVPSNAVRNPESQHNNKTIVQRKYIKIKRIDKVIPSKANFFSEKSVSFAILGREIIVYWQFTFTRCAIGDPVSID
jgi:hypothetical protein